MRTINIYTFENFWAKYHYVTKRLKTNKSQAKKIWSETINPEAKRKAFASIKPGIAINAYEYLKRQLIIIKKPITKPVQLKLEL